MGPVRPPKSTVTSPERSSGERPRVSGPHPVSAVAEPTEAVDLTAEQQKRIADLFRDLRALSLYDLLGVPRVADKKTIKRAYHERAAELHPDRFFRKNLGSFKPKLDAIFARMTEAHDILCSAERRALHDAALQANRSSLIETMLEEAAAEMAGSSVAATHEQFATEDRIDVESAPPSRPIPSTTQPRTSATEVQQRREALARRLIGSRSASGSMPAMVRTPPEMRPGNPGSGLNASVAAGMPPPADDRAAVRQGAPAPPVREPSGSAEELAPTSVRLLADIVDALANPAQPTPPAVVAAGRDDVRVQAKSGVEFRERPGDAQPTVTATLSSLATAPSAAVPSEPRRNEVRLAGAVVHQEALPRRRSRAALVVSASILLLLGAGTITARFVVFSQQHGGASSAAAPAPSNALTTPPSAGGGVPTDPAPAPSQGELSPAPSTPGVPSVLVAAPSIAASSVPASAIPNGMGLLRTTGMPEGRRIFVDQRAVGQTPASVLVPCGARAVKVGSSGRPQTIHVPCGGESVVDTP